MGGGFSFIAFWQAMVFIVLLLLVWADQVVDVSALLFHTEEGKPDLYRGCLITAGVLFAAAVTIGVTYLQARRVVQRMLTICSYCKKVRIASESWQQIEEYIGRHATIDFTHSVCPSCFQKVKQDMDAEAVRGPAPERQP